LIRVSAASRSQLAAEVVALKERFDIPARLRSAFRGHPGAWLGGSLFAGLGASLMLRRKPATKVRKGWLAWVFPLVVSLLRPAVKHWLADRVKQQFAPRPTIDFLKTSIPASQTHRDPL
jgi:hypothetical protein